MEKQIALKVDAGAPLRTTPEGYLIVQAFATRAGVFTYIDGAGKTQRELRPPEEVFSDDSMASLRLKPVTRQHLGGVITADNIKQFQKGTTGEIVKRVVTDDGEFVAVTVMITDKKEIADIKRRRDAGLTVELSAGYTDKTIAIPGTHPLEGPYDAIQTSIRYNHLSIVDKGRAGPHAILKLDDKDEPKKETKRMGLFSKVKQVVGAFHMDAMEQVEVPEEAMPTVRALDRKLDEAIEIITKQNSDAGELQKKVDALEGERDQLKTDHDKLKADHDALVAPGSPLVKKMVEDHQRVTGVATAMKVSLTKEDGTDKSGDELRLDCIMASDKDFVADGRSEDYMAARFDSIVVTAAAPAAAGGMGAVHVATAKAKADAAALAAAGGVDKRAEFSKKSAELAAGKKG